MVLWKVNQIDYQTKSGQPSWNGDALSPKKKTLKNEKETSKSDFSNPKLKIKGKLFPFISLFFNESTFRDYVNRITAQSTIIEFNSCLMTVTGWISANNHPRYGKKKQKASSILPCMKKKWRRMWIADKMLFALACCRESGGGQWILTELQRIRLKIEYGTLERFI